MLRSVPAGTGARHVHARASSLVAATLAAAFMLAGLAAPALAAPKADKYQASITSPTAATGASIQITKPSKLTTKVSPGNVTIQVKVNGVVDAMSDPVTLAANTLQVDVIIDSSLFTVNFLFDLANGKVSQKFTVANSALPGGGLVPGQTMEIRAVRLIQAGNGNSFGVAGLTAR